MKLDSFLNPRSVAIIGASADPKKLGAQVLGNLLAGGFKGKVYPVNLKEKKIAGLAAYASISELERKVELAVIVIPASLVAAEVEKCAAAGVRNIVILSAGFAEAGAEGRVREEEIKTLAARHGLNVLGPNCLGLMSAASKLNLTFARAENRGGGVAFLSQSGAIGSAVLDFAAEKNFGFSKFLSLGNKAVLDENDFFDQLAADQDTKLVIAYLEEIKNGERFMEKVSHLARTKPVAILKAGGTAAGAKAALSHTGSLAGSHQAVMAGLKRSGCIILESLEEIFNLMVFAQKGVWPAAAELHVVSNAGGPVVLLADQASTLGLRFGTYSKETARKLADKLPPSVHIANPLDIIGDADAARYEQALEQILKDKKVANLLAILTPQSSSETEATAEAIVRQSKKHPKKIVIASFIGGAAVRQAKTILERGGVASFSFPEAALGLIKKLFENRRAAKFIKSYRARKAQAGGKKKGEPFGSAQGKQLDYQASLELLRTYGIPIVATVEVQTAARLDKLSYPLALKAVGKGLIHKTESKAVALNLKNPAEARRAFANFSGLLKRGSNYCVAQPMAQGLEMILGLKRDPSFGSVIMAGLGGIYAEVIKDVALTVGDIDKKSALALIQSLSSYKILAGARGSKYDVQALAGAIISLARLAREHPEIYELDINPLFVKEKGVEAADVRIII